MDLDFHILGTDFYECVRFSADSYKKSRSSEFDCSPISIYIFFISVGKS